MSFNKLLCIVPSFHVAETYLCTVPGNKTLLEIPTDVMLGISSFSTPLRISTLGSLCETNTYHLQLQKMQKASITAICIRVRTALPLQRSRTFILHSCSLQETSVSGLIPAPGHEASLTAEKTVPSGARHHTRRSRNPPPHSLEHSLHGVITQTKSAYSPNKRHQLLSALTLGFALP